MSDESLTLTVWVIVVAILMAQCLTLDMCRFDAYSYCMKRAKTSAECEQFLPEAWRR